MYRPVPLAFTWPPILEEIIVIRDAFLTKWVSGCRAAAPKLVISFGERLCTLV